MHLMLHESLKFSSEAKVQPVQDGPNAFCVVCDHLVCDTIGHHYLWPSKLVLRAVHILPQKFVECGKACQYRSYFDMPSTEPCHEVFTCSDNWPQSLLLDAV